MRLRDVVNQSRNAAVGKQPLRNYEPHKKVGLPLRTGSPEKARSIASVVFTPARGSSILASLSEAGGNDLRKTASKPLPPRLPPFTYRYVKRAYAPKYCMCPAIASCRVIPLSQLLSACYCFQSRPALPRSALRATTERFRWESISAALQPSPGTLVMTGRALPDLWVFFPKPLNMDHEHAASLSALSLLLHFS